MSIQKINKNNSIDNKISQLNDMIVELNGLITKARFDKNEIDDLYDQLGESSYNFKRKFFRNVVVGGTVDVSFQDWNDWTYVSTQTGYSIWKINPENYIYNSLNNLYLNDKVLDNRGLALTETSTTFDSVYLFDSSESSVFVDDTTEAGSDSGTAFSMMALTTDYIYVGNSTTFNGIKLQWQTRGSNYNLTLEYWNGSSWTEITSDLNTLVDDTNNFESDGRISWSTLSDWMEITVNSSSKYWIRISTTTVPTTTALGYQLIPDSSVIGLLALSSSEIINESWGWCSYNDYIYVTIRNIGSMSFEGDYFITSSSSSINKENFFVYNNQYTADYESISAQYIEPSLYNIVTVLTDSTITEGTDIVLVDATSGNIILSMFSAVNNLGKKLVIKKVDSSSNITTINMSGIETIDGENSWIIGVQYQSLTIVSDGTNWYAIA